MDNQRKPKREGFWKRQFSDTVTRPQIIFDVIVGAIIPIVLLIFDPVVFRAVVCTGTPVLSNYATFAYLAIGAGIVSLLVSLFARTLPPRVKAFLAGVLMSGAIFASLVGSLILPVSVPGLAIIGIGALGFIPFIVAIIYYRNAIRARRAAESTSLSKGVVLGLMILAPVLVLSIPAAVQIGVTGAARRAVDQLVVTPAQPDTSAQAIRQLRNINTLCGPLCRAAINGVFVDTIIKHRNLETNLRNTYYNITGEGVRSYECQSE